MCTLGRSFSGPFVVLFLVLCGSIWEPCTDSWSASVGFSDFSAVHSFCAGFSGFSVVHWFCFLASVCSLSAGFSDLPDFSSIHWFCFLSSVCRQCKCWVFRLARLQRGSLILLSGVCVQADLSAGFSDQRGSLILLSVCYVCKQCKCWVFRLAKLKRGSLILLSVVCAGRVKRKNLKKAQQGGGVVDEDED